MGTLENLTIYNKSLDLVQKIYDLINSNEQLKKDFSLCDQIKRASISVAANISEGYYRTNKQSKNYLHIATGSCNEIITLLIIINRVYKIDTSTLRNDYLYLTKQISSFAKSF